MRFFRIPSFTGIEAHRDDADRGSLRVVEGCLPHGPGGLRSGPVWEPIGDLGSCSTTEVNQVQGVDDSNGSSFVFTTRNCTVNDMGLFSKNGTEIDSIVESYDLALPPVSIFNEKNAVISAIGNRSFVVGDGSSEAIPVGLDPANLPPDSNYGVQPDYALYSEEWSRFPKCQYYARGPKGALYAAGNPDKPLTVYVSEPAGKTAPWRDSPYSTEYTSYNAGQLSTVEILGSDASKITALSTRGDQVVAHTDKGSFILFAPSADQAETGYRVEQVPATNFSAAVNHQVVSGEGGTQTFWLGHDGQVYKDESSSRGSAELKSYGDEDQANWKSKGAWEFELPENLENSFATFEAQTGNYVFFNEETNYNALQGVPYKPLHSSQKTSVHIELSWAFKRKHGISTFCDCEKPETCTCCYRTNSRVRKHPNDPTWSTYETLQECKESTSADGVCCGDAFTLGDGCCSWYEPGDYELIDCECVEVSFNLRGLSAGMSLESCESKVAVDDRCVSWDPSPYVCGCAARPWKVGKYETIESCADELKERRWGAEVDAVFGRKCGFDIVDCECKKNNDGDGEFLNIDTCEHALNVLKQPGNSCSTHSTYDITDCSCVENTDGDGAYVTLPECETDLALMQSCWLYSFSGDCDTGCTQSADGTLTQTECDDLFIETCTSTYYEYSDCNSDCLPTVLFSSQTPNSTQYETYELCAQAQVNDTECKTYDITDCECVENTAGTGTYTGLTACEAAKASDNECKSYDLTDCECIENTDGTGTYAGLSACENARSLACNKFDYTDCNSGCVETENGRYTGLSACESAQNEICQPHDYDAQLCMECEPSENGAYASLDLCNAAKNLDASYSDMCDSHNWVLDCTDGCVHHPEGVSRYELLLEDSTFEGEMHDTEQACNLAKPYLCDSVYILDESGCSCVAAAHGTSGGYSTLDMCEQAIPDTCFRTYISYRFENETWFDATDTTELHAGFSYSANSINNLSGLSSGAGQTVETDEDFNDTSTPAQTMYFGLYIEPQEGWIYELSIPNPGIDGPFSTLYSSDNGSSSANPASEGLLQLGQVQVFSVTPNKAYDYEWDPADEGRFVFKLTKRLAPAPMYNFTGCEDGFENACYQDDYGSLTQQQCLDHYAEECMSSDCDSTLMIYEISGSNCVCANDPNSEYNYTECDCVEGGFTIDNGINCNPSVSYDLSCGSGCIERQDDQGEFSDMTSCDDAYFDRCL